MENYSRSRFDAIQRGKDFDGRFSDVLPIEYILSNIACLYCVEKDDTQDVKENEKVFRFFLKRGHFLKVPLVLKHVFICDTLKLSKFYRN